jgi:hypothetical protein
MRDAHDPLSKSSLISRPAVGLEEAGTHAARGRFIEPQRRRARKDGSLFLSTSSASRRLAA